MIKHRLKFRKNLIAKALAGNRGQIMIEYVLMFTAIAIVLVWGATHIIRPSVNHLLTQTGDAINNVADNFVDEVSSW